MREYGVTVCSEECEKTRFDDGWMVQMYKSAVGFGAKFHCPQCATRVGIGEEGPWREAMVPRAALEWMVDQYEQRYDDEIGWRAAECGARERSAELMIEAALKAAEEAADE